MQIVHKGANPKVTIVGGGVTIHEALKASKALEADGVDVIVVDPFTIKPLDSKTICQAVSSTGGLVVTVEDHYPTGGIGEAVAAALTEHAVKNVKQVLLAVQEVPRSGTPDQLLAKYRINASAIAQSVINLIASA
ncbi:hypothetical protein Ciccas_011520 [Cichlidogyrus casuarinus]|uniref:transketolase n=1 Tax=Cichlidogyrus casuarinus TaxID=1844966 RepID=A0ABD2PRN1_9PLAT